MTSQKEFNRLFDHPKKNSEAIKLGLIDLAATIARCINLPMELKPDLEQHIYLALSEAVPKVKSSKSAWSFLFCCGQRAGWKHCRKNGIHITREVSNLLNEAGHRGGDDEHPELIIDRPSINRFPVDRPTRTKPKPSIDKQLDRSIIAAAASLRRMDQEAIEYQFAKGCLVALQRLREVAVGRQMKVLMPAD